MFTDSKPIEKERFSGLTFVITGTIPGYNRDEIKQQIEENGGKVTDSISKNTNYLLVGEQPGSKLDKAKKLEVPVLDIEGLMKLIIEE
jgi:DNA ligase (NAD+)